MKYVIFLLLSSATVLAGETIQVALTVDDLPKHGAILDGESRYNLALKMLQVFKAEKVPEVYGFMCGRQLQRNPNLMKVLKLWKESNHPLGNHTFSHPSLTKIPASQYIHEIKKKRKDSRKSQ